MAWDEAKLDALLESFESSFYEHMREDQEWNSANPDEPPREIHCLAGYYMYELLACKPGATLKGFVPTVEGPLFS